MSWSLRQVVPDSRVEVGGTASASIDPGIFATMMDCPEDSHDCNSTPSFLDTGHDCSRLSFSLRRFGNSSISHSEHFNHGGMKINNAPDGKMPWIIFKIPKWILKMERDLKMIIMAGRGAARFSALHRRCFQLLVLFLLLRPARRTCFLLVIIVIISGAAEDEAAPFLPAARYSYHHHAGVHCSPVSPFLYISFLQPGSRPSTRSPN